jgi:hypothetical protein
VKNKQLKNIVCLFTALTITPLFLKAQLTNNGATIVVSTGTNLVLDNLSLQNNGVFSQTAGTVIFSGNVNSTLSGTAAPVFYNLQLNKATSLFLNTGIGITNQLQLTKGVLNLNGNNISLNAAAMLLGENESNYITGALGGYIQIIKALNAPSLENPGNLGVLITSSQDLGMVTIRRGHQSLSGITGGTNSILRYYDISPSNNSSLNATLRFQYLDAELNGLNENNITLWKTDNNVNWTNLGQSSTNTASNFVEQTGINSFSRFTLAVPSVNLPVKWSSFNTQCSGNGIRIGWKTEVEQNTANFTILRSTDARNWISVGVVPAAGNSNTSIAYSYTDVQAPSGTVYYQLQQKDLDGKFTVSPVLHNNCGQKEELNVFPNPMRQNFWVQVQSENTTAVVLRLYDHKGALVQQERETIQQGNNQFQLSMAQLPAGTYTLMISWTNGKTKIVKLDKY